MPKNTRNTKKSDVGKTWNTIFELVEALNAHIKQ
jgi:hypothetical protein